MDVFLAADQDYLFHAYNLCVLEHKQTQPSIHNPLDKSHICWPTTPPSLHSQFETNYRGGAPRHIQYMSCLSLLFT